MVQLCEPAVDVVPAAHELQIDSPELMNVPALQGVHAVEPSSEYKPGAHATQPEASLLL
jgi:hypothetical protein